MQRSSVNFKDLPVERFGYKERCVSSFPDITVGGLCVCERFRSLKVQSEREFGYKWTRLPTQKGFWVEIERKEAALAIAGRLRMVGDILYLIEFEDSAWSDNVKRELFKMSPSFTLSTLTPIDAEV